MKKENQIPKKEKELIDLLSDVYFKSLDNQDKISILSEALIISSKGTKHQQSALEIVQGWLLKNSIEIIIIVCYYIYH